jgi:hypothetical protein
MTNFRHTNLMRFISSTAQNIPALSKKQVSASALEKLATGRCGNDSVDPLESIPLGPVESEAEAERCFYWDDVASPDSIGGLYRMGSKQTAAAVCV